MKSWKLSELKFIKANLHLSDAELAKHFGVSVTSIDGTRQRHGIVRPHDGKFKSGQTPHNKGKHYNPGGRSIETRFKKGQAPSNAFRNVGDVFTIIDRNNKPYQFIKLEHNRQYPYGRYVLEQHFGQNLSKNKVVYYKDRNPANCSLNNLEIITRRELIIKNSNRKKASASMKTTWGVVRTFEDFGLTPPYKLKTKRKTA